MNIGTEYSFLIMKDGAKTQYDPASGQQYQVPFVTHLEIARGKVRSIASYGITLEDGTVISLTSFSRALPVALLEKEKERVEGKK